MKSKTTRMFSLVLALAMCLGFLVVPASAAGYDSDYYEYAGVFGDDPGPSAPSYTLGNPVGIAKNSSGQYYVADMANGRIIKLNSSFQQIGELSGIDMPLFVYVDNSDNVLVNELGTHSILKYDANFNFITSWGGPGTANGKFNIPRSIVQDSLGNYFVSDELNHRIQKFDVDGNHLATYGSWGSGNGQFKVQQGLSIDSSDRLYVADTYNNRIQVFQTRSSWQFLKSFGTYGVYNPFNYFSFQPDIMNHPRGVYVDKSTGRVAVTDSSNNRVMVYNNYNANFSFYQSQNGAVGMTLPTHAIMDISAKLIVLDSHSRILKFNSILNNTTLFSEYGTYRNSSTQFSNPQGVSVDEYNGDVYITDSFNHRIMKYDNNGTLLATYGGAGGPYGYGTALNYFHYPKQTAVDALGSIYVADYANARVVAKGILSPTFQLVTPVGGVVLPWGVAIDNTGGRLFVSDWYDDTIRVFSAGVLMYTFGGSGSTNGKLNKPADLKIGTYQGQNALYVADVGNNRVQIFSLTGSYLGQLGQPSIDPLQYYDASKAAGGMLLPYGIAITPEGNVVVSDTSHKCMRMYDSNGSLLETWATMSISEGNFFSPMGCDIDPNTGRLYVADGVLERVQFYDSLLPAAAKNPDLAQREEAVEVEYGEAEARMQDEADFEQE